MGRALWSRADKAGDRWGGAAWDVETRHIPEGKELCPAIQCSDCLRRRRPCHLPAEGGIKCSNTTPGSTSFLMLYPEPKERTQPSFSLNFLFYIGRQGFPGGWDSQESACNGGRPRFDPWVGRSPWRNKWQLTLVFLPGKSHGQRSPVGHSAWKCRELCMEPQRPRQDWATSTFTAD